MTVWSISSQTEVNVSPGHGGCGLAHRRPLDLDGEPVRIWGLDCVNGCENHLRHDVHWSPTAEDIPLTFDEQKARDRAEKSGKLDRENQLAGAIIELSRLGSLPEALAQLVASIAGVPAVAGQMECPGGHAQPAGQKFCGQCAAPMRQGAAKAALPAPQGRAEPPAKAAAGRPRRLRDAKLEELQALARGRALDSTGNRPELIARLSAAGVTSAALADLLVAA